MKSCSGPIMYCSFSPDGRLFTTFTQFSKYVRVWYNLPIFTECNPVFITILHPRSLYKILWAPLYKNFSTNKQIPNVLFTYCRDNIIRVYIETDFYEPFQFVLLYSLEAYNIATFSFINLFVKPDSEECILTKENEYNYENILYMEKKKDTSIIININRILV